MAHSRYKNSDLLNKACTLTHQGLGFRAKLSYFGTSPLANMQMYRVESSSTIANASFLLYFWLTFYFDLVIILLVFKYGMPIWLERVFGQGAELIRCVITFLTRMNYLF